MEKLLIFNIYKILSGLMWSFCKRRSATQLGPDKRDLPTFDTVTLKFEQLTTKIRKGYSNKQNSIELWAKSIKKPLKIRHGWLENTERKLDF